MATIQTTTGERHREPQYEPPARPYAKEQVQHIENVAAGIERPLPKFADLPLQKDDPQYSAWGLWGKDDEAGTLVSFPSFELNTASESQD
jgi:hypothetical protein